ncbi:msx2-interacting protein-like [Lissotriton helveticus]
MGRAPSTWARLSRSRSHSPSGRARQSRSRSNSHQRRERKSSARSGSPYSRAGRSTGRSCSPHSRVRHSGSMDKSPHGGAIQFRFSSHSAHSKNGLSGTSSISHSGRSMQSASGSYLPHSGARRSRSRSYSPRGSARPIRGSKHAHSHKMSGPSSKVSSSTAELNFNSFCVKVMNLPLEFSDKFILRKIRRRFTSFGNVISVTIHHAEDLRFVVVVYKSQAEQTKALGANGEYLFRHPLSVTAYKGSQSQPLTLTGNKTQASVPHVNKKRFSGSHHVPNTSPSRLSVEKVESPRQYSEESNDSEPHPSRMLFISNLDSNITNQDLFVKFGRFGEIVDVYINSLPGAARQFAFLQYAHISSTASAIKAMNGSFLGKCQVALSFGAIQPTRCVFVEGLSSNLTKEYLIQRFSEHGVVENVLYGRQRGAALILYVDELSARKAVKVTRSLKITGDRIMMDFANESFQLHFCQSILATERDVQDFNCV